MGAQGAQADAYLEPLRFQDLQHVCGRILDMLEDADRKLRTKAKYQPWVPVAAARK